ncbi:MULTISPECIES: TetR/AcrR family transcriptional regulator [unclassified Pseudomonas]|uniref:TetR/AcrR family transcriptional regulator n=1 Tax=unclassified Pseudomonas TaxID=196821 RepID=UPI0007648A50|nr:MULTISPECIES: TetR/AcrR family transcriptional regulator [unclassified Pseudomonas]ULT68474.1 TetR/AcrR family transcriptional regulator [Pseudomonas sp. BC42]
MSKHPVAPPLNPRKAPSQRRSAHTVEAILEAAARILETQGLTACSTNAVAQRAGVSIGSLYQYFPNRDALTVALIERETAQLLRDIQAASDLSGALERIRAMVQAAVAHQLRRPELARVIDFEERRLPLQERHQRVAQVIHQALVEALQLADAPWVLDDVTTVAHDLFALTHGMIDAAGERGETDALNLEHRVMRAIRGYLALSGE